MGFTDFMGDFWEGFQKPFVYVYDHGISPVVNRIDKIGGVIDKVVDKAPDLVDKAFGAADGLLGLLSGNGFYYILGGTAVLIIVTKVL